MTRLAPWRAAANPCRDEVAAYGKSNSKGLPIPITLPEVRPGSQITAQGNCKWTSSRVLLAEGGKGG